LDNSISTSPQDSPDEPGDGAEDDETDDDQTCDKSGRVVCAAALPLSRVTGSKEDGPAKETLDRVLDAVLDELEADMEVEDVGEGLFSDVVDNAGMVEIDDSSVGNCRNAGYCSRVKTPANDCGDEH